MATGDVAVTEGSGKNAATRTLTEDAKTKFLQRINIDNSSGTEIGSAMLTALQAIQTAAEAVQAAAEATTPVTITQADEYEEVDASATDQVLGGAGAAGDRLQGLLINPLTTTPGDVTVKDGSTVILTWSPGTLADKSTRIIPLGIISVNGPWKISTGSNVEVKAVGDFSA